MQLGQTPTETDPTQPQQKKRNVPMSDLDFYLMTTDSVWGKDSAEISDDLRGKLSKFYSQVDKDGKPLTDEEGKFKVSKEGLWGLLGFYTRDMRLAYLNQLELIYCQYYLDLANDFLQADITKPFLICLSRVATVLELSQSKNGFLRRRMHTFTTEAYNETVEPQKKNLFGFGQKKQQGGQH